MLKIVSYDDSNIVIRDYDNTESILRHNFILSPNKIIKDRTISIGNKDDIAYLTSLKPEVLILTQVIPPKLYFDIKAQFETTSIGMESMSLGSACRTYNLLAAEGRDVVLVINF